MRSLPRSTFSAVCAVVVCHFHRYPLSVPCLLSSFGSLYRLRLFQLLLRNYFSDFFALCPLSRYKVLVKIQSSLLNVCSQMQQWCANVCHFHKPDKLQSKVSNLLKLGFLGYCMPGRTVLRTTLCMCWPMVVGWRSDSAERLKSPSHSRCHLLSCFPNLDLDVSCAFRDRLDRVASLRLKRLIPHPVPCQANADMLCDVAAISWPLAIFCYNVIVSVKVKQLEVVKPL